MANNLRVSVEFSISEGKLDKLKELANDIIEKVNANEPDALTYEWYLSEDGSTCHVVETYGDAAAFMAHLGNVGDLLGPLIEVTPLTGLKIYGNPSEELRQAIAPFAPQYFEHYKGFTR